MKTEVIRLKEGRDDVTLTTYVLQDSPDLLAGKVMKSLKSVITSFFADSIGYDGIKGILLIWR